VRAGQLAQHAGQVSFPGGGLEPDETIHEAALRETHEEVGVDPREVRLIGALSPLYIPGSNFALYPVVGVADWSPTWQAAAGEVGRVLETPLAELLTTAGPHRGYRCHEDRRYQVPYFEIGGERVWGATAMILAELIEVIGASLENPWNRADSEDSDPEAYA
jgi:8-oxo-dGTP pyrophosphatase MutT (NUDIX family)